MGRPRLDWREIPLAEQRDTLASRRRARGPLAGPGRRVSMGNPHVGLLRRRRRGGADRTGSARCSSTTRFSRSAPTSASSRCSARDQHPPAGLGARRRHHPGLRHRRLRGPGRGRAARADRPAGDVVLDGGEPDIEWRDDGHVLMTGPAALGFAGVLQPDLPSERGIRRSPVGRWHEHRVHHLRLPAQRLRDRGDRASTPRPRRPDRRRRRQHLRRHRRGRAPGAPGDPQGAPRAARAPAHRHRLRRPDRPAAFAAMAEVDLVLGNAEKLQPESFAPATARPTRVAGQRHHGGARDRRPPDRRARRTARAPSSQVQNGCDHRCTFCIIPYGRGNSRSVPAGEVVEQVRRLVAAGLPARSC